MDMSPLRAPRPVVWLAEAALYTRSSLATTQADSQGSAGGGRVFWGFPRSS